VIHNQRTAMLRNQSKICLTYLTIDRGDLREELLTVLLEDDFHRLLDRDDDLLISLKLLSRNDPRESCDWEYIEFRIMQQPV
jgi:hypothetical protein